MFGTQVSNCQLATTKLKQTGRNMPYRFLAQNGIDAVRFSHSMIHLVRTILSH
jgi:hypothetical protein